MGKKKVKYVSQIRVRFIYTTFASIKAQFNVADIA